MMSALKKQPVIMQIALVIALILLGISLMVWSQIKPYQLNVNGEVINMKALAFYPRDLFRLAEIELLPQDRLSVDPDRFSLAIPEKMRLTSARTVSIKTPGSTIEIVTAELFPASIFKQAGILLFPEDIVLANGEKTLPIRKFPPGEGLSLELLPAKQIDIFVDDLYHTSIFTQTSSYRVALAEKSLEFNLKDLFDPDLDEPLLANNDLQITLAEQVCVQSVAGQYCSLSAAETVKDALTDIGIPLQGLDYAQPPEGEALPENRIITIHEVEERLILLTDETSFAYSYQDDPNTRLDTTAVLVPGQPGIDVSRTSERIEDGQLLQTTSEGPWKASDPMDGVMGRGTRAVLQTETVDGQEIEFWRKVSVYATSYHPSTFGDNPRTRSGLPLQKGTVAVSAAWYPSMALQRVYVQGYGHATIGDSGGGLPGTYWIDLGYSDEDYVGWHSWTTLYFLPPIPAWYPVVLP